MNPLFPPGYTHQGIDLIPSRLVPKGKLACSAHLGACPYECVSRVRYVHPETLDQLKEILPSNLETETQ